MSFVSGGGMLRSRFIRNFLVNALSITIGFGFALIFIPRLRLSADMEEFVGVISAFLISIPINFVIQFILRKLIGPPDI